MAPRRVYALSGRGFKLGHKPRYTGVPRGWQKPEWRDPHCPWQNGKMERFDRTLQTEWAYRQVFTTYRTHALAP
jgi:hypothetical protein